MKRKIIAATMATAMLLGMAAPAAYAEDIMVDTTTVEISTDTYNAENVPVKINNETFPDAKFRQIVLDEIDVDKSNSLSAEEIARTISINAVEQNITTFKGIEYFTALRSLSCGGNQMTSLDLSKNTALTRVYSCNGQLSSLDVSGCTDLTVLHVQFNQITDLDISKNTALTILACFSNKIANLDVSKNTSLNYLYCDDNRLTSLDVSRNTGLTYLDCADNQITNLDVSKNTALTELNCQSNRLTSLDVSKNTDLTNLWCNDCNLTSLNVSGCTALTQLYCRNNQIANLDVSKNTALTELSCEQNCLSMLNLENITGLEMKSSSYSPQFIKSTGTADIAALVGKANLSRVSDTKNLTNGVEYYYDVKGTDNNGAALPKMKVTVNVAVSATATPKPAATPTTKPTASPVPTTAPTVEPTDKPNVEPSAQPTAEPTAQPTAEPTAQPTAEPTTPANPDDNNTGTGDNNDNNTETPTTPDTTGVEGFVDRLYSVCLGREADAAGKADWVGQLTSYQISGTKAAYGFIFSEEFTNMNYSNADFVEHLYEAFMGRASDEGGKADWVGKLDAGTSREEVFNGFANSVEFDNICKSYGIVSKDIETFVTRLYSVCLDRQPDDAGLADWAGRLRSGAVTGKAAASGFVFSEEFTNKNYSNADYVEHLYAAFMGRASDEAGKTDWVGKLDAGTSREEVFNGFADSAEFDNICSSYGIVRG